MSVLIVFNLKLQLHIVQKVETNWSYMMFRSRQVRLLQETEP